MIRTHIRLTEEQTRALKERAVLQRISVAQIVRDAIDRALADDTRDHSQWRRALALMGRFSGGPSDVSTHHEAYLAEDYERTGIDGDDD